MPWLKFSQLGKVFLRSTLDADSLIFLQIRARADCGLRIPSTLYSVDYSIFRSRRTSCISHTISHSYRGGSSFDYKRAFRSDRHEERLYIRYKTCSC